MQELEDCKLEYSSQFKKLHEKLQRVEEKLAKYLKIEEDFDAMELSSNSQPKKFEVLVTKYNEMKVSNY